jgi:CRISPR-associated protein Cas1
MAARRRRQPPATRLGWRNSLSVYSTRNQSAGLTPRSSTGRWQRNGHLITREILRVKLNGQAANARLLGSAETAALIANLAGELDSASDAIRLLAIEALAAAAYWPLWQPLPLRFARREQTPEHWRTFGTRHSPLSGKPLKAAKPGNAILNYLYAVAAGEMTIALTGAGLDPGLGVFHADQDRRASLAYDAIEAVRPYVRCVANYLVCDGPIFKARLL